MAANDPSTGKYSIQTLSKIGEKLYLSEDFADFYFIFKSKFESGNGQCERIPAHKNIIGTASDVFRVMFNGSWKEKTEVEIVDASADAFKEFLQFIYLPEAEVTIGNVAEVMNLGNKYDIAECFKICGGFIEGNLDNNNVCEAFELANHLEHEQLKKKCTDYIERNTKELFESESFLKLKQKNVKQILQMDSLNCFETNVFEALMKWMKAKCAPNELTTEIVHDKFGDLLHEVRFKSMTMVEFLSFDPAYGALFTFEEHREIVQMIGLEQFEPKIFKRNRRNDIESVQWDAATVIMCDRYISYSDQPYYIKNIETTTFTVNKLVTLGAFSSTILWLHNNDFYTSTGVQSEIKIIEIPDSANSKSRVILDNGEIDRQMSIIGVQRILLPKPILIRPGFKYEIQMKQSPPSNCCSRSQLKREVHIEPDITVKFFNDSIVENAARGIISHFEFNRI